jgi:hypothetical protein
MPGMKTLVSLGCALLVTAGTAQAASGILIVQKTTSGGAVKTHQIQIEPTRMRAESVGPNGGTSALVFDGDKQVLYMIDVDKKTYSEMTKADVDKLATQLSGAMAMLQQQMANLSPEQRAQTEAMMKGRGLASAAAAPKPHYRKAGTDVVGKWKCDKYERYEGEEKTSQICTVDPKTLGFSASDFAVTRQLADFFSKIMPQNARQIFSIGTGEDQGFSGVPIRSVVTIGGEQTTSELAEITRQNFAESTFAVPPGFQKREFLGGRGRR